MICLAYIGYYIFSPFLLQNKAEYIFYSLSIAKCNKCYQLALHYSESDAFLLPGDDLKNTHNHILSQSCVYCLHYSFLFSLATVEIALATAIAGFLHVVTRKLVLLWGRLSDSFQSCDRLEDLEGKTSIELQHKRVYFPSRKYLDHLSKE